MDGWMDGWMEERKDGWMDGNGCCHYCSTAWLAGLSPFLLVTHNNNPPLNHANNSSVRPHPSFGSTGDSGVFFVSWLLFRDLL